VHADTHGHTVTWTHLFQRSALGGRRGRQAGQPGRCGCGLARGCSPNTLTAYAYDLRHLWTFLVEQQLAWDEFRPRHALGLLEYLRSAPSRSPRQRLALTVATRDASGPGIRLAPTTVNRALAAVASFLRVHPVGRSVRGQQSNRAAVRQIPPWLASPNGIGRSWGRPVGNSLFVAVCTSRPSNVCRGR